MNSQLLFPHIGKVIASTGSRNFPRMLHALILTQLAVDATHIRRLPLASEAPSHGRNASAANDTGDTCGPGWLAATVYDRRSHQPLCDSFAAAAHREAAPARPGVASAQMHLSSHRDAYRYMISVYRCAHAPNFSAQERIILQDFSSLLLPMVETHISALQPVSSTCQAGPVTTTTVQGLENLRQRFAERLEQSGLSLSNRETEVCIGLLAGRTAPELAEQFRLKVNTVESYLKRASIKMGISGRNSLLRWMYSGDEAAAPCAARGLA